jgi:small subunit ribosomal protein S6
VRDQFGPSGSITLECSLWRAGAVEHGPIFLWPHPDRKRGVIVTATRCYEHTIIARQDLSPQQAQALAESYVGVIGEQGGEVTKNEYWGLRNLAYRVKKNRKGHYLHLNFKAGGSAVKELERQEELSDDVIRYMTVRVDELDDGPSILMQVRSSREERSRRDDGPRRHHGDRDRPDRSERPAASKPAGTEAKESTEKSE